MHLHPGEIIYIFILGIILFLILKRSLFDPVGKILQDREDTIESTRKFLSDAENEINEKLHYREEQISRTREKAYSIKDEILGKSIEHRKEVIKTTREEAYKILTEARTRIQKESDIVQRDLLKEVDSFAVDIASSLLGRNLKTGQQV